jgi:hypothetical protein
MFTKKIMAAAAVAVASLGFTASAQAFTNAPVGSTVTGTLVSPTIALGTFSSCTSSTVSGPVTVDNGPGNGGGGNITSATFGGCVVFGSAATVTANALPWALTVNGAGSASISGINVTLRWGSLSCTYQGAISGAYTQSNGNAVLSGNLTRTAGSSLCPSTAAVSGTYNIRNASNVPVLL